MPKDANGHELETDKVELSPPVLAMLTPEEREYMKKIHEHAALFPTKGNSSRNLLRIIERIGVELVATRLGVPAPVVAAVLP